MSGGFVKLVAVVACVAAIVLALGAVAAEKGEAKKPDFAKMDKDANGKVTEGEFESYIISYPELGLAKAVFKKWDVDKDGVVTVQEFQAVYPLEKEAKEKIEKK